MANLALGTARSLTSLVRSSGSGGPALQALLGVSTGTSTTSASRVAVDGAGNVYITEAAVNKIRMVTPDGIIHDWAGSGQTTLPKNPETGIPIDGGPAIATRLNNP